MRHFVWMAATIGLFGLVNAESVHAAVEKVELLAPLGATTGARPSLSWRPVVGASSYSVEIHSLNGLYRQSKVISSRDSSCDSRNSSVCSVDAFEYLDHGVVEWRVRARVGGKFGEWSEYGYFDVADAAVYAGERIDVDLFLSGDPQTVDSIQVDAPAAGAVVVTSTGVVTCSGQEVSRTIVVHSLITANKNEAPRSNGDPGKISLIETLEAGKTVSFNVMSQRAFKVEKAGIYNYYLRAQIENWVVNQVDCTFRKYTAVNAEYIPSYRSSK